MLKFVCGLCKKIGKVRLAVRYFQVQGPEILVQASWEEENGVVHTMAITKEARV